MFNFEIKNRILFYGCGWVYRFFMCLFIFIICSKKDVRILVVINECRKFLFLDIELECKY